MFTSIRQGHPFLTLTELYQPLLSHARKSRPIIGQGSNGRTTRDEISPASRRGALQLTTHPVSCLTLNLRINYHYNHPLQLLLPDVEKIVSIIMVTVVVFFQSTLHRDDVCEHYRECSNTNYFPKKIYEYLVQNIPALLFLLIVFLQCFCLYFPCWKTVLP